MEAQHEDGDGSTQEPDSAVEAPALEDGDGAGVAREGGEARPQTSTLTIRGQGLSFEREIPQSLVLRIMHLALVGEEPPAAAGRREAVGQQDGNGNGGRRRESLAEFYRRVSPKKYPEKLATIGTYLSEVMGRESFTPDELRSQFRSVNEPPPANLPRDFKAAMGAGWIAEEHDQPGQYYMTQTGRDDVAAGFSSDAKKPTRTRRKRRASKTVVESGESGD